MPFVNEWKPVDIDLRLAKYIKEKRSEIINALKYVGEQVLNKARNKKPLGSLEAPEPGGGFGIEQGTPVLLCIILFWMTAKRWRKNLQ